jgi:HSP20 family molecular chaperone IbpA
VLKVASYEELIYILGGANMQPKYNNLFDVFEILMGDVDTVFKHGPTTLYSGNFPPCNVLTNEEKTLRLEFALSGISKDRLELSVEGDYLKLVVQKEEKKEDGWKVIQHGIKDSFFVRKYQIPSSLYEVESAKVDFKDGLLVVEIPARESQRKKVFNF